MTEQSIKLDVSIVIVCMSNLKYLYPCLDNIKQNTSCSYETFVVAYLFTQKNLKKIKIDYPWITIIESHEIKGFAENNNLALKLAKGKYCLVLNDDTYFNTPVIDELVNTFVSLPDDVAIVSPKTLNSNGSVQRCGKPKYNAATLLLSYLRLIKYYEKISKYTNNEGVFLTYNISGACFMIKTAIFKKLGWFDERYFFCPEDIALSTLANKKGYKCYVNANIELIHYGGGTWSKIQTATMPAAAKGAVIFYSGGYTLGKIFIATLTAFFRSFNLMYWILRTVIINDELSSILLNANKNTISTVFTSKTPKEIFIHFYTQLKANEQ